MEDFEIHDGDLSYEGFLNFAIVTAYTDNLPNSGAVFALSDDKWESKIIVPGLEKPVNTCFDEENEYLYVVDRKFGDDGVIYQYEISWEAGSEHKECTQMSEGTPNSRRCIKWKRWHEGDGFELESKSYAIVYEGSAATDCTVDSYGNLYFPTVDNHIYGISFVDLYQRSTNAIQELVDESAVDGCTGIDVRKNGELWWSNSERTEIVGTLASIKWEGEDAIRAGNQLVEV